MKVSSAIYQRIEGKRMKALLVRIRGWLRTLRGRGRGEDVSDAKNQMHRRRSAHWPDADLPEGGEGGFKRRPQKGRWS